MRANQAKIAKTARDADSGVGHPSSGADTHATAAATSAAAMAAASPPTTCGSPTFGPGPQDEKATPAGAAQRGLPLPTGEGLSGGPRRGPPSPGLLRPRSPRQRSRSNSLSPSARKRRREGSNTSSTSMTSACKINVGPKYQVPYLPPFFLTAERGAPPFSAEDFGCPHGDPEGEGPHTPRLVYSAGTLVRVAASRAAAAAAAATACEVEGSDTSKTAAAAAGESEWVSYVRSEEDLDRYLAHAAASWGALSGGPVSGKPPFSPEFALQLLHAADYNPERALALLREPGFSLLGVCEAPLRRYDNKWRPKDKRGHLPGAPYPPPHTLKTYTHRWHRHNQQSHGDAVGRGTS